MPRIGGTVLQQKTPAHLQGLLSGLERDNAEAPTQQVVYRVMYKAVKQAVLWKLITENPATGAARPRSRKREMQVLKPEHARESLGVAEASRYRALYCELSGCGLRLGEALGLTWPDVDLDKGTLTVRHQLQEAGAPLGVDSLDPWARR